MINGDHRQPETECPTCHGRGWYDDRSSAVRFVRRCPACEQRHPSVGLQPAHSR
jgi:DnaJ-class molecular chaperone